MKVVFIRPVVGKGRCPFPAGADDRISFVPPEGARVRDSSYWRRRVAEGVVTLEADAATSKPAEEPTP